MPISVQNWKTHFEVKEYPETHAPPHFRNASGCYPGYKGYIQKKSTSLVFIEGIVLPFKIGDKNIKMAIVVIIPNGSTHAPLLRAITTVSDTCVKALINKGTVALILI